LLFSSALECQRLILDAPRLSMQPLLGFLSGPGASNNAVPVPLLPCDNARSQPRTTTRVCCPEWSQGRSTLPALSITWRSKPADRRTGEASGCHTVLERCPGRRGPMVQAVDCPPEAVVPLEQTLQAKCHQRTCLRASSRTILRIFMCVPANVRVWGLEMCILCAARG